MSGVQSSPERLVVQGLLPAAHGSVIRYVVVRDRGHYSLAGDAFLGADGAWHLVSDPDRTIEPADLVGFAVQHTDLVTRWVKSDRTDTEEWRATVRRAHAGGGEG